jgi:hypothetical protein
VEKYKHGKNQRIARCSDLKKNKICDMLRRSTTGAPALGITSVRSISSSLSAPLSSS